jgi:hypothetical protein
MTVTNVHKDPAALTMTMTLSSTPPPSASGSCGPTHASWSDGGGHRPIRPPSRSTTCGPAAMWRTT